jgi:DNA excision repair protein ERCC-4
MIDPSAVNSYNSCDSLKDDIIEALKHFANSIITSEVTNDWWAKCDPNDPNWNPWGGNYYPQFPIAYESDGVAMEMAAPEMGSAASAPTAAKSEDSYQTNNQVEGVDEADVIKSGEFTITVTYMHCMIYFNSYLFRLDGKHVFAAYGDILYAWNATDGTTGTSITRMPYNETNCTDGPIIEPLVYDYQNDGDAVAETESSSGKKARREKQNNRGTMSMPWYPPCYNPKPQILALLLHEDRLTAIVSENNYVIMPYSADSPSLIDDHSSLTIKVYDVSNVPSDGTPLTLVGERKLHGNFNAARSIDNTGVVIATSYVNTQAMANSLYRSQPLYCGLSNEEYEEKASLIALNRSEWFADQLISELDLNYGCGQIFKISAMQSGNTSDTTNGDLLTNFVSVMSFDTADEYVNEEIPIALSGSFASGYLSNVYVAQDFVAALAVGSSYNPDTSSWDQSTFVLGFDISNPTPVPYSFGQVSGSPINQYATDLFENHLRIATTEWQWSETEGSTTTNIIFVLDLPSDPESDATMKVVGKTDHLGKPNESIYAVRFQGDTAYVVTFEQIDPFIVVDMNATDPHPIGELEVRVNVIHDSHWIRLLTFFFSIW